MQRQLDLLSNVYEQVKSKFHLEEEVSHIIGELSINLNIMQEIYIRHDDTLPPCILADLPTIRMAIVTLIEFGLRYSARGSIEFQTKMKGYQNQKDY